MVAFLAAILMGAGAVIALVRPEMLVAKGADITEPVRVYAGYLVSRNLAIAVCLLVALAMKARNALPAFLALTALVQLLDSVLDAVEDRWPLVPGVLILGLVLAAAARRTWAVPPIKR